MSFATVGVVVAAALAIVAVAHSVPLLVALSAGQADQALVFATTGLLTAFVAGAIGFATGGQKHRPIVAERLLALAIAWLVAPAFGAIAFVGVDPDALYADAYFDAVSALTTTGAISITTDVSLSPVVMIWRATLQWVGGLATLLMSMVVLAHLGLAGLSIRRTPIPPGNTSGPFGRYWPAILALGVSYGGITLAGVVGLLVSGFDLVSALALAFSAVATGGLMPHGGVLIAGAGYLPAIVVGFMLFAGATNNMRHAGLTRRLPGAYWNDPEFRYGVFAVVIGGAVLAALMAFVSGGGVSGGEITLGRGILWMLSLVSTSVHPVDEQGFAAIPLLVALCVVFVGGSSMSTAGGLKLMRFALLLKQGAREISRLSHPHAIVHSDFGGRAFTMPLMRGVWAMFVLLLVFAAFVCAALTADGLPFEQAVAASVGALSNAGPVLGFASGADGTAVALDTAGVYAQMPVVSKFVLCFAMVAGRLEILAFAGVIMGLVAREA